MIYDVELETSVYIHVPVNADSEDEAGEKALDSLPKYPVAAIKADQFPGRKPNPIDEDDIHVSAGWHVSDIQEKS